jgi:hypothetical protein
VGQPLDPAQEQENEAVRLRIEGLLEGGLETDWNHRADDNQRFDQVVAALRASGNDLNAKLRIAGFTSHPVEHNGDDQVCASCMYYLVHRRWCALPELNLPARAEWSCNIWRV